MKAVGYISSYRHHELDREIELKIQYERIKDYCNKQELQLIKIFEEPETSREDYKPVLLSLLNEASNKHFDKIIVLKVDKFGSDNLVKDWVMGEFKKHNVEIHSLTETLAPKHVLTNKDTTAKIKDIKLKVRDIPSLPEVVTKIMELVQNPNSSAAQLSKVISHDPGLTSRVLRLVNSAYYGFPKQISSIQHAIMILGFTTMRGLVLSSSIFKIFSPKNDSAKILDYKRFWKHTLISAIAAKIIKNYLHLDTDEDIFSAAILHDIGKIILDQYDHANYVKALIDAPNPLLADKVAESETIHCGINHSEIGYVVAEGWNLPESINDIIHYHHNPLECKNNTNLASIVYIGNIIAHIALDQHAFDFELFAPDVLEYLSISEDDLIGINVQVIDEMANIGDLESFFK